MSHTVLVKPAPGRIERSMRRAKTVGMRLTGFLCFAGQGRRALSSRFGLSLPQAVLVSALLHLMLPASVSAAEYLVYADIFNDRIMRAGLDGSNPTVLASNLKDPLSLAVDEQNGKIYYSTYQGGHQAIRRVNLDGSGGDVLVGNLTGFSGLVHMNLNPGTGRIYYYHSGMNPRTIKYFDIANGSSGTTFDGSGVSTNLRDIAIDRANNAVYSIDQAGKIRRVNANGSVDVVYTPSGSGGGTSWWGIAYNPSDQKIYFGSNKYMHRVNANGSGYQQLSGVNYSYSYAVAVDSKNSKLYWGEYGTMFRSNLDGSNKQTVITGSVVSANTSYITAISIAGQGSSASNQSPVATAQSVSVNEDTQLSITLAGTDPEGASLSYALASNPSHGNASLSGNTVTFTPTANYAGSDSFTFTVSDGSITSSAATVSITVNAVNDTPVATAQSVSTNEDTQLSITLAGTDPEGASLSYALASNPSHGNASLSGNTVTYAPTTNYSGSDSFTFTVSDGSITSSAATVSITVNAVNDVPVATAQSVIVNENTQLSITLAGTDTEGASLSYALVSNPSHGNASLSGNTVTFTPTTNYSGSDSFTFRVSDGSATSSAATVSLAINGAPTATAQSVSTNEDTQLAITLAGTDPEGSNLTYALASNPSHGNASLSGNTVTYTPAANYFGSDSFKFTVSDGRITSPQATVSLSVSAVNDAPTVSSVSVAAGEDTQQSIVLSSGSDVDGDDLTYALASNPSKGTATLSGNTVTYTPNSNYSGSDSFTFKASDGSLTSSAGTVFVTMNAVNDAPVATAQSVSTNEDTQLSITLAGTDPEGSNLTYALASNPSKGTASLSGNTVTFTPTTNYSGSDSFTFKVSDGSLTSSAATVSITVNAVNDAPVATAQSVSVNEDTQLSITLAGTDIEGSNLTYALASNPSKGTASLSGNTVTFTPTTNFNGSDSFTFKVSDGSATSSAATVSITVNAVNDAPVPTAQSVSVNEDTQLSITLAGTDPEGNNITAYALASNPSKGTASLSGNTVTYTPNTNYSGSDSFTFTTSDANATSSAATVSITVNAVNDTPVATSRSVSVEEDVQSPITLTGSDIDGDNLTYALASSPSKGTASLSGNTVTYTPNTNYSGSDSFTFKVSDGSATSSAATVSITVEAALLKFAMNVISNEPVAVEFRETISGWGSQNVSVHGSQHGRLDGSYSGSSGKAFNFQTSDTFFPGEKIAISISSGLTNGDGEKQSRPYLWSYVRPTSSSPAKFDVAMHDLEARSSDTRAFALGDLDGDGYLDVVAGNHEQSGRAYFFNGLDWFVRDVSQGSNGPVRAVLLADWDNDGDLDGVLGMDGSNHLLLKNNGQPTPVGVGNLANNADTRGMAIGDIDGDGDIDLITANFGSENLIYVNNGSFNFASPIVLDNSGDSTMDLAMADLDADGDLDVVTAENGSVNKIFGNDSAGVFSAAGSVVDQGAGSAENSTQTYAVKISDIDGDGEPDGVFGNYNTPNTVFLSKTDTWSSIGSTTMQTARLELGDLDGDGDQDVVVGNYNKKNQVYLFDPSATNKFVVRDLHSDVDNTWALGLGDLDHDGDLDVLTTATGGQGQSVNRIYYNSSSPLAPRIVSVSPAPWSSKSAKNTGIGVVFSESVNGSGGIVAHGSQSGRVAGSVTGNGTGSRGLVPQTPFFPGETVSYTLSSTLVSVANNQPLAAGIIGQYQTKTEAAPAQFDRNLLTVGSEANNTNRLAVADVNGDGRLDVVSGNGGSDTRVYFGEGNGAFEDLWKLHESNGVNGGSTGKAHLYFNDTNAKTKEEFIEISRQRCESGLEDGSSSPCIGFVVNYTNAEKTTPAHSKFKLPGGSLFESETRDAYLMTNAGLRRRVGPGGETKSLSDLVVADVTGDGHIDILSVRDQQAVRIYAGNGNGSYSSFVGMNGFVRPTRALAVGDVDLDGDLDLIEGNDGALSRYYLNGGSGNYGNGHNLNDVARKTQVMVVADVNGDGQPDVIEGNDQSVDRIYWGSFKKTSSALFRRSENISDGSFRTRSISVGDLNADGLADLIVGHKDAADQVFVNSLDGSGLGLKNVIGSNSSPTSSVVLGDVDGDGDLDVLRGLYGQLSLCHLNDGTGVFGPDRPTDGVVHNTTSFALGDIDGDGDIDLAEGIYGERNRLHFNSTEVNATRIVFSTQPGGARYGLPFERPPVVTAQNLNGVTASNLNGLSVELKSSVGNVSNGVVKMTGGVAIFDELTLGIVSSDVTLTATTSVSGLGAETSAKFSVDRAPVSFSVVPKKIGYSGSTVVPKVLTDPPDVSFSTKLEGIRGYPKAPGNYRLEVVSTDQNYIGQETLIFTIEPPPAPRATLVSSTTSGPIPLEVEFQGKSSGYFETKSLDTGAGQIIDMTGGGKTTVVYDKPGVYTVVYQVSGPGGKAAAELTIDVAGPPKPQAIPNGVTVEDSPLSIDLAGVDVQSGRWTVYGADPELVESIKVAGDLVTFVPVPDAFGSTDVQVIRTSSLGLTAKQVISLTWTPKDDPPTFNEMPSVFSADEDENLRIDVGKFANDIDSEVGEFKWSIEGYDNALVNSVVVKGSSLMVTPKPDKVGQTKAILRVVDPTSGAEAKQPVNLVWIPINDPPTEPVVGSPANGATEVPLSTMLSWKAEDPDGDLLVYDVFFGEEGKKPEASLGQKAMNFSAVAMKPGTAYVWRVVVRDPSGETTQATARFSTEADKVAPRIRGLTAAVVDEGARIVWETDEEAKFTLSYVSKSSKDGSPPDVGQITDPVYRNSFEVNLPTLQPATFYSLTVVATDRFGNTSKPASGGLRTLAAPDLIAPVITPGSVQVNGISEEGAWVRWATDELSSATLSYELIESDPKDTEGTGSKSGVVESITLARSHALQLNGLKSASLYSFEVFSTDASGNISSAVIGGFKTALGADVIPPTFARAPDIQAQVEEAKIAFRADEVVVAEVRYDVDDSPQDGRVVLSSAPSQGHFLTVEGLEPATKYTYQVAIEDLGGNQTLSKVRSFQTRAAPDKTEPFVEGWRVVPSTERAVLEFAFDEPISASVSWWPEADAENILFLDITDPSPRHSVSLGNLEAATVYRYEITATDAAGNTAAPVSDGFETEAAPDTESPVVLNALVDAQRLESTVLRVDLDEVATLKVDWELTGLPEGVESGSATIGQINSQLSSDLVDAHRISLTKLVPGGYYKALFVAIDPYENMTKGEVLFRAPLRPDTEPPQLLRLPSVLSVSEAGARIGVKYNEDVQLSVRYYLSEDPSAPEIRNFAKPQKKHAFKLNGLQSGVEYTVELLGRDAADLTNERSLSFVTLTEKDDSPPVFTKLPWVESADLAGLRLGLELDEPVVATLNLQSVENPEETHSLSAVERAKSHALEITGLSSGTQYNYVLDVDDANRNRTTKRGQVRTLKKIVAPRIVEGPTRQQVTDDRAWIAFKTNVPARAEISYFQDETPEDVQIENPSTRDKQHVVQLTNLLPGSGYQYSVIAIDDKSGLESELVTGSFRTVEGPDETPPKIQGAPTVASIADMRAKIVWRTDEPSDSRVQLTDPEGQIRLFGDAATTAEHVVELTNLDPGTTYDYTVFSRDLVGNETASSLLSLITLAAPDESPPKFARKPILRTIAQDQVVLAFSADEPASATVEVGTTSTFELGTRTLADQVLNHEVLIDGLLPGTEYFLRVGLTDALGNGPTYAPVVGVITALAPDEIPPQILTGPFSPPATQSEVVIEWTTDEPATRAVRYWIEGQPETTAFVEEGALAQHHRLVLSNLEPGTTYEYVASSVDKVRNGPVESGVGRFRTASRPQLPSFTVEPVAEVDESSGTITWQTNVPSNTVVDIGFDNEYGQRIEKGELVQDHELVISNLEAGQKYHFKVTSTDMSGNVLSTDPKGYEMHSRDLTFRTLAKADVQPPRLIENPTTVWTDKSVVVSWETDEASTSRIEWIALSKGVSNAPTEGFVEDNQMLFGHSLTLTGLSPRTLYLVRVISEDAAGNQMIWEPGSTAKLIAKRAFDKGLRTMASGKITQPPGGAGLFVTDSFPDTRFPVITSGPRVREKTSESVTIEWHTDELSDSFVLFGAQEDSLQEEVGSAQDVQLHSVTLTNLDPGTSYFFRAASTDPSGNGATESGIAVATTSAGADLTPPAYLSDPDIVLTTDVQATIAWTSDEAAAATIEYAPDGGIPLVRNLRRRLVDQQVTLTNLEAGTDYTAFITLRDVNQNETPVPFQVNFTTDAEPDRTPPRLIVNPYVKVLGDESAIIAWETDELADSFVDFDTTPYMGLVTGDPLYKTEHEIRLTNLQPGMTYFFRAGSSDRAQNGPSESEPTVFTTLTDPDLESPAVPSGITVLAGPSAALLEWEPSEAVDFGSYTVYRENSRRRYVAVATGLVEPRYLDESLENGKTYRYRVTASDAQYPANESPQSEKFSVVPDANILGDPPTIFGLEMGVGETHPIVVVSNTAGTGDGTNITYTVQISTEEDFSTIVDREGGLEENASGLTRWRVTRSLDPNTPYWYRVRSNDGRFDGVWSEAIDLKAGDAQPTENSEDFDGDGLVSFRDFFALASGYGSNDAVLDLNAGGTVDEEDVQLFKGRFGRSSGVKSAALKRVEVADGSYVQMTAEATSSDRITLRIDLKGIERLSGYGLNISADPPILKYLGRADSSGLGGRKGSISVVHDGAVLAVAEHLRGLRRPIDVEDGWSIELLFSLEGRPQDVELSMDEGYIGIGRGEILQIQKVDNARVLPYVYALYPNYPNPFNPMTTIRFSIPKSGSDNPHNPVMIELYNTIGQMIRSWDFSNLPMGYHNLLWDGQDKDGRPVASGVYFIRMRAENFVQVRKATLLR